MSTMDSRLHDPLPAALPHKIRAGIVAAQHYAQGDTIGTFGSSIYYLTDATHTYVSGVPLDTSIDVVALQNSAVTVYEDTNTNSTILRLGDPRTLLSTAPENAKDGACIKSKHPAPSARRTHTHTPHAVTQPHSGPLSSTTPRLLH